MDKKEDLELSEEQEILLDKILENEIYNIKIEKLGLNKVAYSYNGALFNLTIIYFIF